MMQNSLPRFGASLVLVMLAALRAVAQTAATNEVEMADTLRNNGKIYVVVTVVVLIVAGLLFYLYLLDRKVAKLEKELNA